MIHNQLEKKGKLLYKNNKIQQVYTSVPEVRDLSKMEQDELNIFLLKYINNCW